MLFLSFFPGFFEPACLFKANVYICWTSDSLFLPLGPNGLFAIYPVNSLWPLLLGLFVCRASSKWPSTVLIIFLFPVTLNYYSCRNNLILLYLFLDQPFIPFLSGLSWVLFCFYSWAPMSLWASLWASTARLLSLGFLGLFANSTLPWAFY